MKNQDINQVANEIISFIGMGNVLDIGSGMDDLVCALLKNGIDAKGLDVSEIGVQAKNFDRFVKGSVLALPFEDESFENIISTDCLEHLSLEDITKALTEIYRVCKKNIFFIITTTQDIEKQHLLTVQGRAWWEQKFFEAGFRKHPSYYKANKYEDLENDGLQIKIILEKIPQDALKKYPLQALLEERDLHMDMIRESGRRSDGHVFRYHFASSYVKPNDRVLDLACGMGYGTHFLANLSMCQSVVGIDIHEYGLKYASDMFPSDNIFFKKGNAEDLDLLTDNSIDLICSFETLEHLPQPEKFLAEAQRVLVPGGRLVISVPNDWSDETGKDPNPYHFHVYTWETFKQQVGKYFIVDECFDQTAGGGFKLYNSQRMFNKHNDNISDSEWLIIVAVKSFSKVEIPLYQETVYLNNNTPKNLLEFGKYYKNPWLVHSLVEASFRLRNTDQLIFACQEELVEGIQNNPDYGAALTVYGYQILSKNDSTNVVKDSFINRINEYLSLKSDNPHIFRWQVSLGFLKGELLLSRGLIDEATKAFDYCISLRYEDFAFILGSKIIQSARKNAFIMLSKNNFEMSKKYLTIAIQQFLKIISSNSENLIGSMNSPLTCNYYDLMRIVDDGMNSVTLLSWINKGFYNRGAFNEFLLFGSYKEASNQVVYLELELNKITIEKQQLFEIAEERLIEQNKLVSELDNYKQAFEKLTIEKQQLFEIAEERLIEQNKLVSELDNYKQAFEKLTIEKQQLFEIAEERLIEQNKLVDELDSYKQAFKKLTIEKQQLFEMNQQLNKKLINRIINKLRKKSL